MIPKSRTRGFASIASAALLALIVTACGGSTSDEEVAEEIVDSLIGDLADEIDEGLEEVDSTVELDLPDPVTRTVSMTGWWGGFAVTVDQVTAEPAPSWVDVVVDVTFGNLGDEAATPPPAAVHGEGLVFDLLSDEISVAGGGQAPSTLTASVDSESIGRELDDLEGILDALTLVYGETGDNQTLIPFGPDDVDSFEPRQLDIAGEAYHGDVVTTFTTARLQPSYQSGDGGRYELTFADPTIAYECSTDCNAVGFEVEQNMFSLTEPSGASTTVAVGSPFCCGSGHAGDSVNDGDMVFLVSEPVEGQYSLAMTLTGIGVAGDLTGVEPVPHTFEVP